MRPDRLSSAIAPTAILLATILLSAASPLPAQGAAGQPVAGQGAAEAAVGERDWRLPFRNPIELIDPPTELWDHFKKMYARAHLANAIRNFDENGIEMCEDEQWKAAYREILTYDHTKFDMGYVSQIVRRSVSAEDRKLALYGMFYHPNLSLVAQMINHIPGEPSLKLRESSYPRALAFLRAQLPAKNPGDLEEWSKIRVGPAGTLPPKPGEWSYDFDEIPYFMLLQVDSPIDQRQALWFLGEIVKIRPDIWKHYLGAAAPQLYHLLKHDDKAVRGDAIRLLEQLDPDSDARKTPGPDSDPAVVKQWIDSIMYGVFPPIRPISPGLTELFPSADLDAIVERGEAVLSDGSLGDTVSGRLANSRHYRGLRIARVPEPLDMLGIKVDWIVTSINGLPVASCKTVLEVLKASKLHKSFMIEYVEDGKLKAKQFSLQS